MKKIMVKHAFSFLKHRTFHHLFSFRKCNKFFD